MILSKLTQKWVDRVENPDAGEPEFAEPDAGEDEYGNPTDGSRLINCCFPDCGCDGSRLCMAEQGASGAAQQLNFEKRTR